MSFFKRLLGKDQEEVIESTASEAENVQEASNMDMDNSELIAVIAAAVASMMNQGVADINIKTIRRIPQNTIAWADMGRKEQMLGNL